MSPARMSASFGVRRGSGVAVTSQVSGSSRTISFPQKGTRTVLPAMPPPEGPTHGNRKHASTLDLGHCTS